MKARRAQPPPPLLPPNHKRDNRHKKHQQDNREREPGPIEPRFGSEGQDPEPHVEGQAAREVEEVPRFGRLRLVAVGDVGVETG